MSDIKRRARRSLPMKLVMIICSMGIISNLVVVGEEVIRACEVE